MLTKIMFHMFFDYQVSSDDIVDTSSRFDDWFTVKYLWKNVVTTSHQLVDIE